MHYSLCLSLFLRKNNASLLVILSNSLSLFFFLSPWDTVLCVQVERSLTELQVDYIDLYLVHWPVPGKHVDCYKTLEKLHAAGKIKVR